MFVVAPSGIIGKLADTISNIDTLCYILRFQTVL